MNNDEIQIENEEPQQTAAVLSDTDILTEHKNGRVVIYPFNEKNLNNSSYDVCLGPYYYREQPPLRGKSTVFNPYCEKHVAETWGQIQEAVELSSPLTGIDAKDRVIWINPGETILAHTQEFIGGRDCITSMLKTKSSWGRSFISVCKCAGWGDVSYFSRWTLEITNHSQYRSIPLVVGRPMAQVVFFWTGPVRPGHLYQGKYQSSQNLDQLIKEWTPASMLPRLYVNN